jgi:hypothetical protein
MPKPPEQTFDFRGKPKPLVAQFKDLQDACEVRNTHELTVHGAVWKSSVVTKTFVFGVTSIKKTGPRRRTRTEP